MIKKYALNGLDCANCAAKIETSIQRLNGVVSASVNFMTATLHIEMKEDAQDQTMLQLIEETIHRHEPDIIIVNKDDMSDGPNNTPHVYDSNGRKHLLKMAMGAVIFGIALLLDCFIGNPYIPLVYSLSYIILGGNIVLRALKNITRGKIFDENFLMSVATIGAFIIGKLPEAVAVVLFYQVGEYVQGLAVRKSKNSITDLMDIRPDFANLKRNGELLRVSPDTINIGDIIVIKPGEKIPLDGIVIEGESMLDTTALTGESVPRKATVTDTVLSGCVNLNGVLTLEVTKTFNESTVAKIIDLVENATSKKAPTENFITVFARYYTPIVVGLATLVAIVPPLFAGGVWGEWINRGLIFLVISCPCALLVSIPLGFFGGIGGAAKRGILVKGGNYLEALAKLDIVVFDKTGTLTKGVFKVTNILPIETQTKNNVLKLAAHAEAFSNHPIAFSIAKAYGQDVDRSALTDYEEIAGQGIRVKMDSRTLLAGNYKLMESMGVPCTEESIIGTKVYVAVDNKYVGCIVISDEIKEDAFDVVALLKRRGISKSVMLTGDNPNVAQDIAEKLKIDEVHGGLLPTQKVDQLECLIEQKRADGKLAFVGDGINDAPVLALADVGVSMGGLGSDAAIEAADVVLMTDEPSKLAEAVDIARFTKRIVWQNIIFALGIKGLFLFLSTFGVADMWEAVFADVGVALLAVLNATRVIRKRTGFRTSNVPFDRNLP